MIEVGIDVLRLTDVSGLDSFAQLAILDVAGGAEVLFADNTILLLGVAAASLKASDVIV